MQFKGTISKVTPDGRSGIVTLDDPPATNRNMPHYAVISPSTRGRIDLMNGAGHLDVGTRVALDGDEGPSAIKATVVIRLD